MLFLALSRKGQPLDEFVVACDQQGNPAAVPLAQYGNTCTSAPEGKKDVQRILRNTTNLGWGASLLLVRHRLKIKRDCPQLLNAGPRPLRLQGNPIFTQQRGDIRKLSKSNVA